MQTDQPQNEIAAALSKAQAEMRNPTLDATNPHFRNRYASLLAVRDAVVPTLAKHGIAVCQNLTTTERGVACETVLLHSSGQHLRFGPLVLPAGKLDAQGFGSASTYARRYSLMSVAGVVGDPDDDAETAVARESAKAVRVARAEKPARAAHEEKPDLFTAVQAWMKRDSITETQLKAFLSHKGIACDDVPALPERLLKRLLDPVVQAEVKADAQGEVVP